MGHPRGVSHIQKEPDRGCSSGSDVFPDTVHATLICYFEGHQTCFAATDWGAFSKHKTYKAVKIWALYPLP